MILNPIKSLFIIAVLFFHCSSCQKHAISPPSIEINQGWEFQQKGKDKWYSATVPGVVHTDLLDNNLIEDPYWENNEQQLQWIEKEDWIYRTTFILSQEDLKNDHIELQFDGLDTYTDIKLNGQSILSSNNMFRKWKIEVKNIVHQGDNQLEIYFHSPLSFNKKRYDTYPYQLPSGSEKLEPRVGSFTRKAAYHFGWDWGPRFVTCGIWKNVHLNFWNTGRITDVYCYTKNISKKKAQQQALITVEIDGGGSKKYSLAIDGIKKVYNLHPGKNIIKYDFTVEKPELWWCNGKGDAHLYNMIVELFQGRTLIDTTSQKYGIRTIELINEKDSIGTSYYFKLNGQAVFMKGANYIPQDMFIPRVKEEQYHQLLGDVKAANMNMLRVWGGGIYEQDIFYDLCDKNGILVWQDFMFAGSLYPTDTAFIDNIKQEIIDNIIRLRGHPSIALWCGNNEIEVAWNNWGWQQQYGYSAKDSTQIWQDYTRIFHQLIPMQLANLDPSRNYVPTSPLSNWGTAENFNHSSMHYWGVWHGREAFEEFDNNVGRFMVEYGFQSFPSMETIRTFAADSSLYLNSITMQNRQKSYIGNGLILKHIENYYDSPNSFEAFVNLSQKTQAKAMKMAINTHINAQPHCMGTLFWQLNDCWPGPSWSVIDYYGRQKTAYGVVQESFK